MGTARVRGPITARVARVMQGQHDVASIVLSEAQMPEFISVTHHRRSGTTATRSPAGRSSTSTSARRPRPADAVKQCSSPCGRGAGTPPGSDEGEERQWHRHHSFRQA